MSGKSDVVGYRAIQISSSPRSFPSIVATGGARDLH